MVYLSSILALLGPILFLSGKKNYSYSECYTVSVKVPKMHLFLVTLPKIEVLPVSVVIELPPFRPSVNFN